MRRYNQRQIARALALQPISPIYGRRYTITIKSAIKNSMAIVFLLLLSKLCG